jgi:ubiquinone/menaquinone biosynthesis C-methylase UbiE
LCDLSSEGRANIARSAILKHAGKIDDCRSSIDDCGFSEVSSKISWRPKPKTLLQSLNDRTKVTNSKKNFYERAGIDDKAEFYGVRYASEELLGADYFDAINRFDIRWARTIWVYDNVRRGSTVLDLGCGAGVLALLKRKQVTLVGVDLSRDCAAAAQRNGYDMAVAADLESLPFKDQTFDYVVSLDVMGHIEFDQKDQVIGEIVRVLKHDGVTLHGIETLDRSRRKDYDEMSEEELRSYVQTDGHVGMEDQPHNVERFGKFFQNVESRFGFGICQPHSEFIKQSDDYGREYCEPDLLNYLRAMSFKERRAFDIAMGYVFEKISESDLQLPQSEYLLLKASNAEPGVFYHEHRDRADLEVTKPKAVDGPVLLDFSRHAAFESGWYQAESFPPIARWMSDRARVSFLCSQVSKIKLDLQTHMPGVDRQPLHVRFLLDNQELRSLSLDKYGWIEIELVVPESMSRQLSSGPHVLEILSDRVWQPKLTDPKSIDDRELSIAVCSIRIFP